MKDCPKKGTNNGDCKERGGENKKFNSMSAKAKGNAHFVNYTLLAHDEGWLGMTDVLLDNQANISTFKNKNLLVDIAYMEQPGTSIGVTGDEMITEMDGLFPGFFRVGYNPDAVANILSLSEVENNTDYEVQYSQGEYFRVYLRKDKYIQFNNVGGLYIADLSEWNAGAQFAKIKKPGARAGSLKMYKPRSARRAQEAQELQRNMGYPSAKTMSRMINKSAVKDCPIRAEDLRNAIKKDGRLPEEVRGKTVRRAIDAAPEVVTDLPDNPELKAYSDIMIMRDECKFLVTVLKHADPNAGRLDLTLVQPLTRVNAQEIGAAMQDEMDVVATRGYAIRTREVDLQLYTGELKSKFRGVAFEVVGAGDHVPVAENKVKTIKERCRCVGAEFLGVRATKREAEPDG